MKTQPYHPQKDDLFNTSDPKLGSDPMAGDTTQIKSPAMQQPIAIDVNRQPIKRYQAIIFLVILFLNHLSVNWNLYLFSYLKEGKTARTNIEVDIHMSDTQFGLLTGSGYNIITAICSLFAGRLADNVKSRKLLLICATMLANLSTMCAYFTHNFYELMLTRILFAIFQSAFVPTAISVINDLFEYKHKSKANCVFIYGVYWGICLSSLTMILDESIGWRLSLVSITSLGLIFSLLLLIIKEPVRGFQVQQQDYRLGNVHSQIFNDDSKFANDELQPQSASQSQITIENPEEERRVELQPELGKLSLCQVTKMMFGNACFIAILLAGFFRVFGSSYGYWSGSYFEARYPEFETQYSIIYTIGGITGSFLAELIGGIVGDALEPKYPKVKGFISGMGTLLATPFLFYCFAISTSFYPSAFTLITNNFLGVWYGPLFTMINKIFPSELQGQAIAVWTLINSLGTCLGTFLIGVLSDHYQTSLYPERLGVILGLIVTISYCISGPCFFVAAHIYGKKYARLH